MLGLGSIASTVAAGAGLIAVSIAVFGFIAHVAPALSGAPEVELRRATAIGGLVGLGVAVSVIVLSVTVS